MFMELQIQDLVDSIKKDGIAEAEKERKVIISEATKKADEIVKDAQQQAKKLVDAAKKEVTVMEKSATAAIQQAGRDVILYLKKSITNHVLHLLDTNVTSSLTGKDLVSLIVSIVQSGLVDQKTSIVEVNAKELKKIDETLRAQLADELKNGLEITPVDSVHVGFKLSSKDGSFFYDFSDDEITQLLLPFLSSSIAEMIQPAKEGK